MHLTKKMRRGIFTFISSSDTHTHTSNVYILPRCTVYLERETNADMELNGETREITAFAVGGGLLQTDNGGIFFYPDVK